MNVTLVTGSAGLIGSESVEFFSIKFDAVFIFTSTNKVYGDRPNTLPIGKKLNWSYSETNRIGDHIWWISDVSKFKSNYPDWDYKFNMNDILQ